MSKVEKITSYPKGDPRRVLLVNEAQESFPDDENLWRCNSTEGSAIISDSLVNGGFLVVKLREAGVDNLSATQIHDCDLYSRIIFFVVEMSTDQETGFLMAFGYLLQELEDNTETCLLYTPVTRVVLNTGNPQTDDVDVYDLLNTEEIVSTWESLVSLQKIYPEPEYQEKFESLFESLYKQNPDLFIQE